MTPASSPTGDTTRCCNGTGFADYAAVPCPNPDCTATPQETPMDLDTARGWFDYWASTSGEEAEAARVLRAELDRLGTAVSSSSPDDTAPGEEWPPGIEEGLIAWQADLAASAAVPDTGHPPITVATDAERCTCTADRCLATCVICGWIGYPGGCPVEPPPGDATVPVTADTEPSSSSSPDDTAPAAAGPIAQADPHAECGARIEVLEIELAELRAAASAAVPSPDANPKDDW